MKSIAMSIGMLVASSAALMMTVVSAEALTLGVSNITGNNSTNSLIGETQLQIEITDSSGGENGTASQALFKFLNIGPAAASITQIYFDHNDSNPLLAGISSITNGPGTRFEAPRKVGNLPGGNPIGFDEDFSIEPSSQGGTQPNGVNPGEHVSVLFNLAPNKTLADVFAAVYSSELKVGFHVQGYANGGSESFVNEVPSEEEPTEVPEPGLALGLAAMVGALRFTRQRSAKSC